MTVRKEQFEDGCYLDGIGVTSAGIAASQSISLKRIADALEVFLAARALSPPATPSVDPHEVHGREVVRAIAETAELRKRNAASPKR